MAGPDHPADAFLHEPDFPIEDESNGASAEFQVSQQLGFMDGQDRIDGFVFDDDAFIHAHVGAIPCVDEQPVITDRNFDLFFGLESSLFELIHHAALIGGFEQAGSEGRVDFDRRIDNLGCNVFDIMAHASSNGEHGHLSQELFFFAPFVVRLKRKSAAMKRRLS